MEKEFTLAELEAAKQEAASMAAQATKKRFEDKYVKQDEYEKLKADYEQLQAAEADRTIVPKIKDAYVKAGGNEAAFEDFIKLNREAINTENDSELEASISNIAKEKAYLFNTTPKPEETKTDDDGEDEFYPNTLIRKRK